MLENITENESQVMKSRIHSQLPALFALAHDHSETGRLALADKLADIFFTQAVVLTSHEEELVNDLISDLLLHESSDVRTKIVSRFTQALDAPREIALRIINGPREIAEPILMANENLRDDDLISVIENKGLDHAAAVAKRKKISEAVADALVTTGDLQIMQIVAENLGAKLSSKALNVIVDAARVTAMLQKPILARPELTPESAATLYWWTAQDVRRAILDRFGFGPGKLDLELKKTIDEKLESTLLQKEDTDAMKHLADWLQERQAANVSLLPQLLRAGHYRLFNVLLARLAKINLTLVDTITNEGGGKYMVTLCRAIGIDKGNFVSIFLMARACRSDEQIVQPRELTQALTIYDRLTPETAFALLQTWQMNPSDLKNRIDAEHEGEEETLDPIF